ncbi:metallophosphoesterase [Devosia salina]|uniref:Metallophosphoesterase n=1 Tax=Devosia salina TaxID=2860336 RepID=A0ABX8WD37_9HYPH|nr:metallophosphoesterase [Devosia salina]QYO76678.1 metallophosphoesterase [Devosia salina]
MTRHTTFLHLTDLHIAQPGVPDAFLSTDTSATLAKVLADIKTYDPAPDFIVVSGDLTNRGTEPAFEELKRLLDEAALPIPMLLALGNHDSRAPFYKVMLDQTENADAPYDYDTVIAGTHIIVLDTSIPMQGHGALEPGQLDWFRGRLADHAGVPKLIVMHHPLMLDEDPASEWQGMTLKDTIALREVLQGRTDILGILCGHLHHDRVSNWHGIPLIMTGGQHDWIDPIKLEKGRLCQTSGASIAVGTIRSWGLTVAFMPRPEERKLVSDMTFQELVAKAHDFYETEAAE